MTLAIAWSHDPGDPRGGWSHEGGDSHRLPDAGKVCRSNRDCVGECLVPYDWFEQGQCSYSRNLSGCPTLILVDRDHPRAADSHVRPGAAPGTWPRVVSLRID